MLVMIWALMSPQVTSGGARVGADHFFQVIVHHPATHDFQRWNQQAFLKQVGCIAGIGAGHLAAEIGLVGDVADEGDQLAVVKHRRDDR